MILYILALLIGLLILYLVVIIFFPVLSIVKQPFLYSNENSIDENPPICREDIFFKVGDTMLNGWLYLPEITTPPVGCIVMSHGFGGTKDMLLEKYALRFVEAGMSVLTYDYRHFGKSEGIPRQQFSIEKQLDDLTSAIEYARSRKEIDPKKIALWGTSAAGGYGLNIAANDPDIACIIGQCPALDAEEDGKVAIKREGIGFILRLIPHAQRDKGRARFGLSEHTVPIVGKPGSLAFLTAPGAYEGYSKIATDSFINEVCARVLLTPHNEFSPVNAAKDVKCPVLLQICEHDNLVSKNSYIKTAEMLGEKVQVILYPIGHFDIYEGDSFEKAIQDQIQFVQENFKSKKLAKTV